MQSYTPGLPVVVRFALVNDAGAALTPTALRYRVLDEAEAVIHDWSAIEVADPVPAAVDVTVIGAYNILTPPATRGARTVELEVTTAAGTVPLAESFILQGATALSGTNSFQTYTQAVLLSDDFADSSLAGWAANLSREAREKALIEAHGRILRLPIVIEYDDSQSIVRDIGEDPWRLADLTPAQVASLDAKMLTALRQAQLVEADEILDDDPVKRARRAGLVSMTVGESSQFFGTSKPLDMPVCGRALKLLERWLRYGALIARR